MSSRQRLDTPSPPHPPSPPPNPPGHHSLDWCGSARSTPQWPSVRRWITPEPRCTQWPRRGAIAASMQPSPPRQPRPPPKPPTTEWAMPQILVCARPMATFSTAARPTAAQSPQPSPAGSAVPGTARFARPPIFHKPAWPTGRTAAIQTATASPGALPPTPTSPGTTAMSARTFRPPRPRVRIPRLARPPPQPSSQWLRQ